jgi:hypothetical protein
MNPALLQPHPNGQGDAKPGNPVHDDQYTSDFDSDPEDPSRQHPDGSKRPRLRLAHACDRCRRRKIRCDTKQPCAPCSASKTECTFNTPSRRVTKPKVPGNPKRPHSPGEDGSGDGGTRSYAGTSNSKALEERLAALEAMLGDVPPKVHNAYLSSLDARLGSGTGVGIKEGKGEGVGPAIEALSGSGLDEFGLHGAGGSAWANASGSASGMNASWGGLGSSSTLAPDWDGSNWLAGNIGSSGRPRGLRRKEDEGVEEMAKRMEGMSFFYEDEIGQAKWQGRSLLSLDIR